MTGSSTTMVEYSESAFSSQQYLDSSFGSLSSKRRGKSELSKAYRQASELFLTRRLSEALLIFEPLITVPQASEDASEDEATSWEAPIARATGKTRAKLWGLYLTLLNAIIELDPDDGSKAFGKIRWQNLNAKIENGTIWDEVINVGYKGVDGNVDPEVITILATLLLAQATDHKSTQQRLESYLSSSDSVLFNSGVQFNVSEESNDHTRKEEHHSHGTGFSRDLKARVGILELYTLHVLPRNGEWEYARDFLNMSELLDEETREALLQNLQILKDDAKSKEEIQEAGPEREVLQEQEPHPVEDTGRESIDTMRHLEPSSHHRSNSEIDYGVDSAGPPQKAPRSNFSLPQQEAKPGKKPYVKPSRPPPNSTSRRTANSNLQSQSLAMMRTIQNIFARLAEQLSRNPMGLLRFVLFLMGLIMAFSRRDVKDRVGRLTGGGWDKIKRTIGMGMKVSYV
ncbi:hypothetical protein ACLMJK_004930 [Lecanora helva]